MQELLHRGLPHSAQTLLQHVLARVPEVEVEVEAAGEHEAALGTALVLHRHQLADVRLEIQIRRILFLTISVQYFLTSSNTYSLKPSVTR